MVSPFSLTDSPTMEREQGRGRERRGPSTLHTSPVTPNPGSRASAHPFNQTRKLGGAGKGFRGPSEASVIRWEALKTDQGLWDGGRMRNVTLALSAAPVDRKREQGVSSPLSLLAPTMHQAVIMTHGSQYEGKTTLPPRQRRSRNPQPHLFSALLESSGMDSPAGRLGHPWSWACLLSGEHRQPRQW